MSATHKKMLLRTDTVDWGEDAADDAEVVGASTTAAGISNFAMTLLGCGILALPKVFATSGILLGIFSLAIAVALTIVSCKVIAHISEVTGMLSYSEMVRENFGSTGSLLLQMAIFANNFGVSVVSLICVGDLLVGDSPDWTGLLPDIAGDHSGSAWYLSRWFWITMFALCEVPLVYLRDLGAMLVPSSISIAACMVFSGALATSAALAASCGSLAPDVYFGPDPVATGSSFVAVAATWLAVLPVMSLSFTVQFNVLPIKASLSDKRPTAVSQVIMGGTSLVAAIYAIVAVSGYLLFGRPTEGNVFSNFTAEFVTDLLLHLAGDDASTSAAGTAAAVAGVVVPVVKLAVVYMLLITFVLNNWGLRECVSEVLFDRESLQLPRWKFYIVTYACLGAAWGIACLVTDVFTVMQFVGSLACTTFCNIIPGLLMSRLNDKGSWFGPALGYTITGLGFLFMGLGLHDAITQM